MEESSNKNKRRKGGDAGQIFISARKIQGDGKITADGGDGSFGGKGGKVTLISEDNQFKGRISTKGGKSDNPPETNSRKQNWGKWQVILAIVGIIVTILLGVFFHNSSVEVEQDDNYGVQQFGAGSVAIQNINEESSYTWINSDSWEEDVFDCGEPDCKYAYLLSFFANGPIVPLRSCLMLSSDAKLVSVSLKPWQAPQEVLDALDQWAASTIANICLQDDVGRTPVFLVEFSSKPSVIKSALVKAPDRDP